MADVDLLFLYVSNESDAGFSLANNFESNCKLFLQKLLLDIL